MYLNICSLSILIGFESIPWNRQFKQIHENEIFFVKLNGRSQKKSSDMVTSVLLFAFRIVLFYFRHVWNDEPAPRLIFRSQPTGWESLLKFFDTLDSQKDEFFENSFICEERKRVTLKVGLERSAGSAKI